MKLTELLDQIDQLDQEATKGPWENLGYSIDSRTTYDEVVSTEVDCGTYCMGGTGKGVQDDSDAEFIALSRTALPAMNKALRAVMVLHPRHTAFDGNLDFCPICVKSEGATYPCDTVRAITDAMEGDDE